MSSPQSVFSQAGESPPSAPQLSGLKNEVGREIHKPVLKNLFAGKLLIDPLGPPPRPSAPFSFTLQRWRERNGELPCPLQEMLPPKPLGVAFEDQVFAPKSLQSLGPLNCEMVMSC